MSKQTAANGARKAAQAPSAPSPVMRFVRNSQVLAVAGLLFIAVVLFGPFLFSSDKMVYGSDIIAGLDARVVYKDAIAQNHELPSWLSSRLSGTPTIDASFGDALYPPTMLIQPLLPVNWALGLKALLHVVLAGVFFYLMLLRGFRTSPLVAFAGAAFYMLNPQFISLIYSGHEGKLFVTAWVPFLVWRLKALMERPALMNATLLALGIAMSLLTGHVQLTYFVLWGLFLYWVFWGVMRWRETKNVREIVKGGVAFWGAVFLGIGLAFVLFFPNVMFVRQAFSVRGVDRGFEYASSWSLHWPEMFSLWVPEFANWLDYYWSQNPFKLNTEYAGAMVSLLAVLALVHRPKPWRLFWGGMAVLALLFALGAHTPVFAVVYYLVPGVKKMRACSMIMFWFSFSLALLSCSFLADVVAGEMAAFSDALKRRWERGLLLAMAACTLAALIFSVKDFTASLAQAMLPEGLFTSPVQGSTTHRDIFDANFSRNFVPMLWLWWLWAVGALGALWAVIRGVLDKRVFVVIVLAIGIIDLVRIDGGGFAGNTKFVQAVAARPYTDAEPAVVELHKAMEHDPFRVFTLPGTFPQNGEGVRGLESVSGFHDNELRWYREFRGDQSDGNFLQGLVGMGQNGPYLAVEKIRDGNSFLDLANARYVLGRQGGALRVFENKAALGRVSFVKNYVVMDSAQIAAAIREGRYDIRTTVAFAQEPAEKPSLSPAGVDSSKVAPVAATATWERYTPNYRRVVVDAPSDGFLRISEVYYPGWEIRVDGSRVPICRADLAWMAVSLHAGRHTIEIIPHSLYLAKAALVSIPLWLLVLGYWGVAGVAAYRTRRRGPAGQTEPGRARAQGAGA